MIAGPAVQLAQEAQRAPLFSLDNAFWMSVLVIFLLTIISAFIRRRQRDRCLKLFDDYHSTLLSMKSPPLWGDLCVTSDGIEIVFDAEYVSQRGLSKTSALVFTDDLADTLAVCRPIAGLNEQERRDREKQLRSSINPNMIRRFLRWLRNTVNTISDAITRTFTMLIGRVSRTGGMTTAIRDQQGDVTNLSKTVIGMAGNAYEPLLERHIGSPVVYRIVHAGGGDPIELPGHLVEYSARYIAIFNTDTKPIEQLSICLTHNIDREDLKISVDDLYITVACTGSEPLVLLRMTVDGTATDLAVGLLPGTRVRISKPRGADKIDLDLAITRRMDLIIPRIRGGVRFGSARPERPRRSWRGISPQAES